MFWKESIQISEQMYQTYEPAMYATRIFGLFPVSLRKEGDAIYLKWSPMYAFYSFFIGMSLSFLTYRGLLEDTLSERWKSIKIKSDTDVYVEFCDISGLQLVMIFGIFINGFEFSYFLKFIQCLSKVDTLMQLNDTKSVRRAAIRTLIWVLLATISITTADILMYFRNREEGNIRYKVLKCYLPLYATYYVVMMIQYRFWNYGDSILRRLRQLNENLENFNSGDKRISQVLSGNCITKLTIVYVKLCEAVDFLNQFSGATNTITTIDILWHFIEVPYHLLSELNSSRKDPAFISMMVAWIFFHISRLLILVEPCNSCKLEVDKMKILICKLVYSETIDQECKLQLETFSTVLAQCKLKFSAAGLTKIDRSLITTLIGTVSTYLVVLMQFQNNT